ncbi:PleD family two-component system response regulator [Paludibacterium sp. B53371]|uniref:response regulator n=1 Tax=Paludibacterium sp. B53371 TaxID=2806263 RepID=UPI001C053571|nr:response regulator [Paludibacterium sp. B53371]
MSEIKTILLVDDDPMYRMLTADALTPHYRLLEAESGADALMLAREYVPALVLLDITLADQDGFQVCRQLKQHAALAQVPVVFISANVSLSDRLAAYEAGGEDFIGKPVEPDELRAKVSLTLKNVAERLRLESGARDAMGVAMTAMSSASELGVLLGILRRCFAVSDESGLAACVRLQTSAGVYGRSQQGVLTRVEAGVLDLLSTGERIVSLGRQSVFNYGGLTLLIKNMPDQEPDRAGRLRDHLAMLAEGGQACLRMIEAMNQLRVRERARAHFGEQAMAALAEIDATFHRHQSQTEAWLESTLTELQMAFPTLGLTDHQENIVLSLVGSAAERIAGQYAEGLDIAGHLHRLQALAGDNG